MNSREVFLRLTIAISGETSTTTTETDGHLLALGLAALDIRGEELAIQERGAGEVRSVAGKSESS